jgi:hypothetical protein
MSTELYTPIAESLAARVVTFFARFPDEEMLVSDIRAKWGADTKNVPVQLQRAVEAGLLERDGSAYKAGPNIGRINLTPEAQMKATTPMRTKGHVRTVIDIEAIEFEDAPPELQSPVKVHDRWMAKLRTMPAGKSFTVGYEYRHALRTAASALRKQGWKISVLAEGEEMVRAVCLVAPEVQS